MMAAHGFEAYHFLCSDYVYVMCVMKNLFYIRLAARDITMPHFVSSQNKCIYE